MSLILDALKKARELTNRKPAPPPPTALASFRFGRPSRSEKTKRIALFVLLAIAIASSVGYTANLWMKRLRKPRAVLIQAPQPALPAEPAVDVPPAREAVNQTAPPAVAPKEAAKEEATLPARALAPPPPIYAPPVPIKTPLPPQVVAPTPGPQQQTAPQPALPIQRAPASLPTTKVAIEPSPAPPPVQAPSVTPARDPFDLAVFYQRSGDYLKALEQYNKVLEKDPLNAAVYNNLGLIHYATGNTVEAIRAFRQATYIDPKYDKAHNNLGLALRQAGQDAEAEREFERALQLNPKNAEALTNLAALAKKSGNIERAKVQYLQALQVNPANAEAHYNLAMLYEEQGENSNASDHFKKFLTLGSSSHPEVVAEVEKKIEELSKKKE